jgi:hypothetical protein
MLNAESSTSGRWWLQQGLPLLVAVVMLAGGFWLRWPNVSFPGPHRQDAYNDYAFDRFSYSDISSLYYRDNLVEHPAPYVDYRLEYPVGMGALMYLLNWPARTMRDYFLITSALMAASGLAITWLVPRFPRGRSWLVALSPALALYVSLNWDMWGVLLTVVALLLFARGRDAFGSIGLALAIWTKFFPIVMLPLILADRLRDQGWRAASRILLIVAAASAMINAPLLIGRPDAWLYFFETNRSRPREVNLWNLFDRWGVTTATINTWSAILLIALLAVLLLVQWRGSRQAWLLACCAILSWFFFVNKVYSPQYSLWIVVLLAAVGAPPALAAAWSATDLIYFWSSFVTLGQLRFGDAAHWFYDRTLMPAMLLREGMLLLIVVWCIWAMRRPAVDAR